MIQSVQSMEEATKIIKDVEFILSAGGFVVKHWVVSGSDTSSHEI